MKHNARLRGWQRITTKLKHNNRNHRGSMGLETPRVGSPFEAFVMHVPQREPYGKRQRSCHF
ncbi:hypothetical protein DLR74_17730 [Vibrio paracholerae]|nr:hypothetical protein DLR74_17730 [Vibrio paracholerae]